jgi:hypothetical protein
LKPVETELFATKSFLGEARDDADQVPPEGDNMYVLGNIGKHDFVVTYPTGSVRLSALLSLPGCGAQSVQLTIILKRYQYIGLKVAIH